MKESIHIFQGLKRDNHQIRQGENFLWNAHNIRLTSREDSTDFSVTNERGTEEILSFTGDYVGHCVLGKYLVVFTSDSTDDYIYRLTYENDNIHTVILYKGNLNISPDNPIQTLGCSETTLINKVYWIDGINQARFINITMPELKEVEEPTDKNYTSLYNAEFFNFVPVLKLNETVEIKKMYGTGMFSAGVIQYAFTYFNKYAQESNIFYTTPIQYISSSDKVGSAEDVIATSFYINLNNLDSNFDYIRVYSIHRTSLNAVPAVSVLPDIRIPENGKLTIIDNGSIGASEDPAKLLYIGGRTIVPKTIAEKDGTMFLGNIKSESTEREILNILKDGVEKQGITISQESSPSYEEDYEYAENSYYLETEGDKFLNTHPGFKTNEYYRIGVQAQLEDGTWTSPVHITDCIVSNDYPVAKFVKKPDSDSPFRPKKPFLRIQQFSSNIIIEQSIISSLSSKGVKKLRACAVLPTMVDRNILCQGILNPTVYNAYYRSKNAPFAQASWLFRPSKKDYSNTIEEEYGGNIEFRHNHNISGLTIYGNEIQNADPSIKTVHELRGPNTALTISNLQRSTQNPEPENEACFFVDENIVTFNSPDIELGSDLVGIDLKNVKLKIIGFVELESIFGDVSITTSSPKFLNTATGFNHKTIGYPCLLNPKYKNNGGLVTQLLFEDEGHIDNTDFKIHDNPAYFYTHLFHRSGSLNDDETRPAKVLDGTPPRTAVLKTKIISNLKCFGQFTPIDKMKFRKDATSSLEEVSNIFSISTPQLFNSDVVSILRTDVNYAENSSIGSLYKQLITSAIYQGNIDTLITTPSKYTIYRIDSDDYKDGENKIQTYTTSKDPVRMKYKSTPHLMFRLLNGTDLKGKTIHDDRQLLLPRHEEVGNSPQFIQYPMWITNLEPDISEHTKQESDPTYYGKLSSVGLVITSGKDDANDITNYMGYTDLLCNYITYTKDDQGNDQIVTDKIIAGNVVWDSSSRKYTIESIPKGGNKRIFKIDKDTTSIYKKSWVTNHYELYNLLQAAGLYNDKGDVYKVRESVYITVDGNGYIAQSVVENMGDVPKDLPIYYFQPLFETPAGFNGEDYKVEDSLKPHLLVAELIREVDSNIRFGGNTENAIEQNLWIPAGDPILLSKTSNEGKLKLLLKYGDTWYTRYDCLKTYPFTNEDENQVVEIGSFMCETRVNLNGRYDSHKGQLSNLYSSPSNYNLINSVYSQKDNFFNYRVYDEDYYKTVEYPNQVIWSKEKHPGEEIDTWTNITLANSLELPSDRGELTSLQVWNEALLGFQEKALSQILFNSRVQIPVTDGVPIEISNSYKVDGYKTISDTIGCYDKWAIKSTSSGVYFIDKDSDSIYVYDGKITPLGEVKGLNWWAKKFSNHKWSLNETDNNGIRIFNDTKYSDVYFSPGKASNQEDAACYSEKLGQFTSFMSYGGVSAMFNFGDGFYSINKGLNGITTLYRNSTGNYNSFYGKTKGWDISFIENKDASMTKIFDTIELRADIYDNGSLLNSCPIKYIKAENEYQKANAIFNSSTMRKKFRVWRGIIPRNNNTRERIRNTWSMFTVGDDNPGTTNAIIHDISIKYTI